MSVLLHYYAVLFFFTLFGRNIAAPLLQNRAVSSSVYDDLVLYAKFSSAVYQPLCPRPVGAWKINSFDKQGTQGFVVRDDDRKEIILAFRGSMEIADILTNIQILLTPLRVAGVNNVGGATVHTGFQKAYNVVHDEVMSYMKTQIDRYPSYKLVVTGHSLGGAVCTFAALALKARYPNKQLRLFTYGAPRIGNADFASLVETRIGMNNIYRGVHTWDGVPTILGRWLGYRHYGTEYWEHKDPSRPENVRKCNGGEDTSCSNSIISTGINPPHAFAFGQVMAINPFICW
ncbi:hypothetical protein ONZ45_g4878 [Pleurotus djamor]|nr:hypothetical protein ONZ45_g4878 [Pleurotus djamor]